MSHHPVKLNPWPYSIIAFFVLAILAISSWVAFAMRNNMELVRADYYVQDVLYQRQIDRLARTSALRAEIDLTYDSAARSLNLLLPQSHAAGSTGTIHLYRPSDASLDQKFTLALSSEGSQRINVPRLRAGFWKVNVTWTREGQEYCFEQPLLVDPQSPALPPQR